MCFISYLDAQGVFHQDSVARLDKESYIQELTKLGCTNIQVHYS